LMLLATKGVTGKEAAVNAHGDKVTAEFSLIDAVGAKVQLENPCL